MLRVLDNSHKTNANKTFMVPNIISEHKNLVFDLGPASELI